MANHRRRTGGRRGCPGDDADIQNGNALVHPYSDEDYVPGESGSDTEDDPIERNPDRPFDHHQPPDALLPRTPDPVRPGLGGVECPPWALEGLRTLVEASNAKEADCVHEKAQIKSLGKEVTRLKRTRNELIIAKNELESELRLCEEEKHTALEENVALSELNEDEDQKWKAAKTEATSLRQQVQCSICTTTAVGPDEHDTGFCSEYTNDTTVAHPMCRTCVTGALNAYSNDHTMFDVREITCGYEGCTHTIPTKFLIAASSESYTNYACAKYSHQREKEDRERRVREQHNEDSDSKQVASKALEEYIIDAAKLRTPCCGQVCELHSNCCALSCDTCKIVFCGWCYTYYREQGQSYQVHDHIRFDCEHNTLPGLLTEHPHTNVVQMDRGYNNKNPAVFKARHQKMQEDQIASAKAELLEKANPAFYVHA